MKPMGKGPTDLESKATGRLVLGFERMATWWAVPRVQEQNDRERNEEDILQPSTGIAHRGTGI
jgi:hypothetical protein